MIHFVFSITELVSEQEEQVRAPLICKPTLRGAEACEACETTSLTGGLKIEGISVIDALRPLCQEEEEQAFRIE